MEEELASVVQTNAKLFTTIRVANQNILASTDASVSIARRLQEISGDHDFRTMWPIFLLPVQWLAWGVDVNQPCPWPSGTKVSHYPGSETESEIKEPGSFLELWRACDTVCPHDCESYIESIRHGPHGLTVCFGTM